MVLEMDRGGISSGISDYLNCLVGHGDDIMESGEAKALERWQPVMR